MKYQKDDLATFSKQINYALEHYQPHGFKITDFDNIVLCGLGGSGIAGRIVKSYFYRNLPIPLEVISDYDLPAYTGKRTLTLQCSYSGNTEETLSMYKQAKEKGAAILSIATGGQLEKITRADGNHFYTAESGFQPRMALGYSLTYLLLVFAELQGQDIRFEIKAAADSVVDYEGSINEGREITGYFADSLKSKWIVVADYFTYPTGVRFCQQMQENAKSEAFVHELPESNHNVIESYYGKLDSNFIFLNSHLNPRTDLRFKFLKSVLEKEGNKILEIDVDPDSLSSVLRVIYKLDWVSLLVADHKGVNSIDIRNIIALKQYLLDN